MIEQVTSITFEVANKIVISDPCYIDEDDAEQYGTVEKALEVPSGYHLGCVFANAGGEWEARIAYNQEGRVAKLIARRKGSQLDWKTRQTPNQNIGVDSGQMLIGCAETAFGLDYNALLSKYSKTGKRGDDPGWGGDDYNGLDFFGFNEAAVSSTGYGDGSYPVELILDYEGRPAQVTVDFMCEEEDDGDEYF